jgi:hypothetical protein
MGGSSGRQHPKSYIGYAAQGSGAYTFEFTLPTLRLIAFLLEIFQMSQTGTSQSSLRREAFSRSEQLHEVETDLVYTEPTSDYEYLEYCNSESPATPAQSTWVLEPLPWEDERSIQVPESNLYPTDPLPPSFDALEFPTSPLPPSSPLPSSTTYEYLLSHCQASHGAETMLLDFDKIPLPSTVSGSCEVTSSSRYGGRRHITPDLASGSPLRHPPISGLAPMLLTPYSKADLIPDLLTCDDPWNIIGDMLDLPPIPSADATYFNRIRSCHTLLRERVSSQASSSSLGQVKIEEPPCTAQDEGTRLMAVHSDGDLLNPSDPSSLGFSHKTSSRTSSLLCRDSPKKVLSPARPFRSIHETRLSCGAESYTPSSSPTSDVLSDVPQSPLEPHAVLASPGPWHGDTSEMGRESSTLMKTLSPSRCILTPQRSTSPSPKNLNSLKKSVSRSPGILSSQWNITTKFDPVEPIPAESLTQITASRAQLPKLECPNLFEDEDSPGGMF